MPYRQNGDNIIFFYFKQRYIPICTKANDKLANKRAICLRFAAGERKGFEQHQRLFYGG